MSNLPKVFGILWLSLLVISCGTTQGTSTETNTTIANTTAMNLPADSFCLIAKPIRLSHQDVLTDETQRAIIAFNSIGMNKCGWK